MTVLLHVCVCLRVFQSYIPILYLFCYLGLWHFHKLFGLYFARVLCCGLHCPEGGIRANAFVTGGFLPDNRRGVREEGFMTTADWYATYARLAGENNDVC